MIPAKPYNGHLRRNPLPEPRDLIAAFFYDPETGTMWRKTNSGLSEVGYTDASCGYVKLSWNGFALRRARVAFAIMEGRWPHQIDHINRNRSDDRWSNLREVTQSQNAYNKARPARQRIYGPYRRRDANSVAFDVYTDGKRVARRNLFCAAWKKFSQIQ